jgi:hypothetical protein
MLGAGKHRLYDRLAGRSFGYPGLGRLNIEKNGAGKAHRS